MVSTAWLESSMRRSRRLGLEVLERASRRSVDWTSIGASQTPTTADKDAHVSVKRTHSELDDAFESIAELMVQTACQCKRYYDSARCSEPSDTEKTHMSRFHSRPRTRISTKKQGPVGKAEEDFSIEVSPGTYAITASLPESQQQTQLVRVEAGESVSLTFNL
ncbi:A-kinase-interacting protein 1 [Austrofundulus limnaeus]|uniref:A-kinase-interacting protein 1 n=1 Tax=Austrofundulus limnaeus TaxID=52670 RepID=A0A2I4CQK7_AUSLI|nr:PREDICTED: A-kinase-interacting protein 1 [Austrofundulus limnaeus]